MPEPIAFILNHTAGSAGSGGWLERHRAAIQEIAAGGPVIGIETGGQIAAAVERALASGCGTIVAGGGDGTLNAVASRLVGGETRFGVLPLGTLNHFAKDLGLPLDPLEALHMLPRARTIAVDVGEVNGHYFLNNSSLGLYVDMVRDRERQQTRLGRGKWPAFAWALLGVLRRYPFLSVALSANGREVLHRTPLVFIGNNVYRTDGLQIGERDRLQEGCLSVYVAERAGRARLLALGLRALLGRLRGQKDFRAFTTTELRIDSARRRIGVALDGETRQLEVPLRYRIHAGALRVLAPEA